MSCLLLDVIYLMSPYMILVRVTKDIDWAVG